MSINNSYRLTAQSGVLGTNRTVDTQQKNRVVTEVKQKAFTYEESAAQQPIKKVGSHYDTESLFSNSAQELYHSVADSTQGARSFAFNRFQKPVFSASNSGNSINRIEVKRHQNYFNQIMNFDNPVGSWIDTHI